MNLRFDDWVFDVRFDDTASYSKAEAEEHCTCGYCRNFYEAIDSACPNLRNFLGSFGLNIEAPDELMPFEVASSVIYFGTFAVCGNILSAGRNPLLVDGVVIEPVTDCSSQINTACPEPCFYLQLSNVTLDWVLDEPMESVESAAKSPSFISKIWDKLFGASASGEYLS